MRRVLYFCVKGDLEKAYLESAPLLSTLQNFGGNGSMIVVHSLVSFSVGPYSGAI